MGAITQHETQQVDDANASGRTPVVFVHGLWLLPSSWDRWRTVFEDAGYATLAPGWPDDPETVAEANANPDVFAKKSIKDVADHFDEVIQKLDAKPAIIGHSFGGLMTQILAGRGLSAASVAIDPAPFRGVLPLPISALRSASPVLTNPLNHGRAVPLTYEQLPTPSPRTRRRTCTRPSLCRLPVSPSSRQRLRTSTRGPRTRSTRRTQSAGPS